MSGSLSRFFKHSAIYAFGNALNRVGAFLLLPLYTRYLSVGDYGALEIFYSISAVVSSLLSVGIAHATLRFYFDHDREEDRKALVSTNLMASLVICGAGAALIGLVAQPLATHVLGRAPSSTGLMLVLMTLVLELSGQVGISYLRAKEMSVLFISVSFAKLVVQCTANALLLSHFNMGVDGVLAGNFLAVALGWLIVGGYTLRQCGLSFQSDKLFPVLKYSLPFLYISIIGAAAGNFDKFALNRMLSIEALGVYALATKFSKLISDLLGEPFNRAYGAFRFSVMKGPDAAELQANIMRYVSAALAFISLAIIYFTEDVLHWVATPEYAGAAALMPLLVMAASIQMLIYILQTGILVSKDTQKLVRVTLVRSLALPILGTPLIWFFGLQGACILQLCDAIIGAVMTHRISQAYFPVRYDMRRACVLVGVGVLFAALQVAGLAGTLGVSSKLVLLCVFAGLLYRTQLQPHEAMAIKMRVHAWRNARTD